MPKPNPIPAGAHTLTPNLTIQGCGKAIDFYTRALGAQVVMNMPSPDGKAVWHAELKIGDSSVYMNDPVPGMSVPAPSRDRPAPTSLWLWVRDCDAAYKRAVEAGGKSTMAPADMFWGDRNASILDPFGYQWTFATHVRDMTQEEMKRAGEEFAKTMKMPGA